MQKPIVPLVVAVLLGLITVSSAIAVQKLTTGKVVLRPVDALSTASESARGRAAIIDNGEEIVVRGVARGLLASETYVSLFYDQDSVPKGPNACTGDALFIGEWTVGKNGVGKLSSAQSTSFRLGDFGTMSIRRITEAGPVLVSCGAITNR